MTDESPYNEKAGQPATTDPSLAELHASLAAIHEAIAGVEKQFARAGKEQFKANALAESGQKNLEALLEQWRDSEAARERTQSRELRTEARGEGRLEVIQNLLPVLDGLNEAVAAGERVLPAGQSGQSFGQRWRAAMALLFGSSGSNAALPAGPQALAWLQGVRLVQERLAEVLAQENVYPIATVGQRFDPHRHVAVEAVPASTESKAGTIVRETRRGYVHNDTVLRYAEVVVAREAESGKC